MSLLIAGLDLRMSLPTQTIYDSMTFSQRCSAAHGAGLHLIPTGCQPWCRSSQHKVFLSSGSPIEHGKVAQIFLRAESPPLLVFWAGAGSKAGHPYTKRAGLREHERVTAVVVLRPALIDVNNSFSKKNVLQIQIHFMISFLYPTAKL